MFTASKSRGFQAIPKGLEKVRKRMAELEKPLEENKKKVGRKKTLLIGQV